MNKSRNTEPVNGAEVVSPPTSKPIATHNSGNHTASFLEIMEKTVLHHKIPYWNENETKGDGNCFYNAIIDQIQNNPGVYDTLSEDAKRCSTPSELRAAVITFIASWPEVLSEQETLTVWKDSGLGEGQIDWESYIDEQGKNGVYADDLVIHCTATFLAKDIYVTTNQNPVIWRHINSHTGTNGIPITLASNQSAEKDNYGRYKSGREHFQSLIPTIQEENKAVSCRNCAQPNIKRLKSHFNNSKKSCEKMYDLVGMAAAAKAKSQQKNREKTARYYQANKEAKKSKQAEYDSQHRQQKQEYYRQHTPEKLKKQAEYYKQHTPEKRKRQAEYDSEHRPQKRARDAASLQFLKENQDMAGRLKQFRQSQRDGLSYVCASCCRLWFKSSVVDVSNPRCKVTPDILEPLKMDCK